MKTTSHFVGISLKSYYLANIFIEIKLLLGNNCNDILEFQNPLSLHITLYYFPKILSEIDKSKIKSIIKKIDIKNIEINFDWLHFFNDNIAYIWYKNFTELEDINTIFKQSLLSIIPL